MRYSDQQLAEIAGKLRGLPAVVDAPTHTKQAAIRLLAAEIRDLRQRGYSLEAVCECLETSGLAISAPTLRNYLARAKKRGARPSVARGSKAANRPRDRSASSGPPNKTAFHTTPDSEDI